MAYQFNYPQYANGYSAPTPFNQQFNPYMQQQAQQMQQPKCNIGFVTSLQDALARVVEPNSDYFYRHQTEPLMFEIITDNEGRKASHTYNYKESILEPQTAQEKPEIDLSNYVTKEDIMSLVGEINGLKQSHSELVEQLKKLEQSVQL